MKRLLLFMAATCLLSAQDAELSNNFSGISLTFGVGDGSDKGVAYMEEYLYHDKLTSDRKVVYIKDTTAIAFSHNSFNNVAQHNGANTPTGKYRVIGANGLDGTPATGDEGIIRYRIDREGQTGAFGWTSYGAPATFPAYSAPITFAGLTYQSGVPVVGTTGIGSGYQRGILDATGDEWHVMAVGDDDSAFETSAGTELQASDGKIYHFVVNPKAPAITVRITGDGQFYTTPAKVYLAAKVHAQTTYMTPGTGTVTFELRDLYARNISYRINGGSWVNVGAATVTLSDTDFANTGGTANTLEYYSVGFVANTKTRTIYKNPTHPSLAESHGHYLWGNSTELAKITARLTRTPYLSCWNFIKSTSSTMLPEWVANGATGHRQPFFTSTYLYTVPLPHPAQNTAFVGLVSGWDVVPSGYARSWGSFAKDQMMRSIWTRVDPVEYERNQSNGSGPSSEVIGAGYYHINTLFSILIAYDIIAGHYRSDQNAAGLTPVEDYFIRDILATAVLQTNHSILYGGSHGVGVQGSSMGLWYGARAVGAQMVATCLKEYSTPYYGTSGYGTVQTQYTYTPHPTFSPTWKSIYGNTPAQSATVPGTTASAFTIEDPTLWQPGGVWGGPNIGYFNLMGRAMCILLNINARYSPSTDYPYLRAGMLNAVTTGLTTITNPVGTYLPQPTLGNALLGSLGSTVVADLKARGTESTEIRDKMLFGLVWYDDGVAVTDTTPPTATGLTVVANGTSGTMSFSETVAIGAGGSGGLTMSMTGGAVTATLGPPSGATIPVTFSRTINQGQTGTWTYTQPGNGIEDAAGNDMATATSQTVTNNSIQAAADTTPPSPNPPTCTAVSSSPYQITITSALCTDAGSAVQYRFSYDDGQTYSAWQSGRTLTVNGLAGNAEYSCRVQASDSAPVPNITDESAAFSVLVTTPPDPVTPTRARRSPIHFSIE